jgi:ATP-binding cassette subfamily A (ABC1) protein 3
MHLISGALLSVIFWVLRLIESTRRVSKIIAWFFRLMPSFSFAFGIINLSNASIYATVEGYRDIKSVWDFDIAGGDILMLGLEGFVYMVLVFWIEHLEDTGSI